MDSDADGSESPLSDAGRGGHRPRADAEHCARRTARRLMAENHALRQQLTHLQRWHAILRATLEAHGFVLPAPSDDGDTEGMRGV
jgi:hypothetical protein